MYVKQYSSDKKQVWDEFIRNSKNPLFMFYRDYMEYHKDRFADSSLMFYDDKDDLISVLPASIKGDIISSHGGLTFGGFVTDSKMKQHHMCELMDLLTNYMSEQGVTSLIYKAIPHIYHLQPAEEDIYALYKIGASIEKIESATVVNLSNRLKMPKGRKAQVSRARREGVTVEESTDFDTFINLENEVLGEYHNATAVHTGAELKLLHERFPEFIKLYGGFYQGKMIAGSVIFLYPNVVHTQYLASNDKSREIGALDLVVTTMMDIYKDKTWFDFGKSTEGDGTILNEGLISQKEGFGGRTFVYQTWKLTV